MRLRIMTDINHSASYFVIQIVALPHIILTNCKFLTYYSIIMFICPQKRQLAVELCKIVESILCWAPTPQSALHLLRLTLIQNCAPVLKAAPSEMLQRTFADLFRHDTPGNSNGSGSGPDPKSFVSAMTLSEKATAVVAHLCHTCSEAVVSDTTLLNAIVSQV